MIYLVRHGETEWNRLRLLQGQTDIPLSEEGAEEIRRQAMRLKEIGFQVDHIVTSPLKRAAQTAQILADIIGYTGQIQVNDDLKERCFGKAEGLSLKSGDVLEYRLEFYAYNCLRTPRIEKVTIEFAPQ